MRREALACLRIAWNVSKKPPLTLVSIWWQTIADRRSQKVLRSSAIIWKHTSAIACGPAIVIADDRRRSQKIEPCSIFCDRLRSSAIVCDPAIVLRSAIEMYPIIVLILTNDSTLLIHKARMFVYSNAHLLLIWLALNIVAGYECVYNRNSKNFKDKHKSLTVGKKSARNLIEYFRIHNRCFLRFWSWRCRRFRTKRRNKFACSKISCSMSAMLFALIFPRAERAGTFDISSERNV